MAATYTKPIKIPRWADTSTNVLEPAEAKKDEGWLFEEIPPSAYDNWSSRTIGEWFKWINERAFDGVTKDELLLKSPGSAVDALRIADSVVTSELPFTVKTSGTARLSVGATLADFSALDIRTTGAIQFTTTEYFNRHASGYIDTYVNGALMTRASTNGLEVVRGLQVGSLGTPTNDEINADGAIHAGGLLTCAGADIAGYVKPTLDANSNQYLGAADKRWYSGYIVTINSTTVNSSILHASTSIGTTGTKVPLIHATDLGSSGTPIDTAHIGTTHITSALELNSPSSAGGYIHGVLSTYGELVIYDGGPAIKFFRIEDGGATTTYYIPLRF